MRVGLCTSIYDNVSERSRNNYSTLKLALTSLVSISGHFDGEDISKAKDEGIMKRIKENGEGFDHPNVSYQCMPTNMCETEKSFAVS